MRSRTMVLGCALVASASAPARGQSLGKMLEYDVKNGVVDMAAVWIAPLHSRGRDWLTAAGVLVAGAAISPFDDNIDAWFYANRNSNAWDVLKELRQGGVAFSGKTITPVVGGLYIIGLATRSTRLRDAVWGCAASYASSSIVRNYVMYQVIGRLRPDSSKTHPVSAAFPNGYEAPPAKQGDQYKFEGFPGGGKDAWGKHSLPGGHVANIAACAGFLGNRFTMGYAEPIAYLVAAGVGVGRLVDRRHWTSDTFVGAAYGYAVGKEIAKRSLRRRQEGRQDASATDPRGFFVTPSAAGVNVGIQWTF